MGSDTAPKTSPGKRLVPAGIFENPWDFGRNPAAQRNPRPGFPPDKVAVAWVQHQVALRVHHHLTDESLALSVDALANHLSVEVSVLRRKLNGQMPMTLTDIANLSVALDDGFAAVAVPDDEPARSDDVTPIRSARVVELERRVADLEHRLAQAVHHADGFLDVARYLDYQSHRYLTGYERGDLPANNPLITCLASYLLATRWAGPLAGWRQQLGFPARRYPAGNA